MLPGTPWVVQAGHWDRHAHLCGDGGGPHFEIQGCDLQDRWPSPAARLVPASPSAPPPQRRRRRGLAAARGANPSSPTLPVDSVPRKMHRYTTSQARMRHSAGSHCTAPLSWMDGEMLSVFRYQKYCVEEAFSHSSR